MLSNSLIYKGFSGELGGVEKTLLMSYKSPKNRVIAQFLWLFGLRLYS